MKLFLRALGVAASLCGVLICATLTFVLIKKVWFGGDSAKSHVSVVELSGLILSSSQFTHDLEEETKNPGTKAVVVRINSPGGLVAPSQEIYDAIRRADKKIPVIISMESLAASGGYYAALGGRKIFANPGTLTASIGVIMEFANTEKLYQWGKVDRFTIKSGKFKDTGTPFRAMRPEEKELLQTLVLEIYRQFRTEVKQRRKMTDEELDAVADGRVVSGTQAKEAKLVDAIGGLQEALIEAKALAKLPEDAPVKLPEKQTGLLKKLLFGDADSSLSSLLTSIGWTSGWKILLLAPVR